METGGRIFRLDYSAIHEPGAGVDAIPARILVVTSDITDQVALECAQLQHNEMGSVFLGLTKNISSESS